MLETRVVYLAKSEKSNYVWNILHAPYLNKTLGYTDMKPFLMESTCRRVEDQPSLCKQQIRTLRLCWLPVLAQWFE